MASRKTTESSTTGWFIVNSSGLNVAARRGRPFEDERSAAQYREENSYVPAFKGTKTVHGTVDRNGWVTPTSRKNESVQEAAQTREEWEATLGDEYTIRREEQDGVEVLVAYDLQGKVLGTYVTGDNGVEGGMSLETTLKLRKADPTKVNAAKQAYDSILANYEPNPLNPREVIVGDAAVEVSVFDGALFLDSVRAFSPGNGAGTAALQAVLQAADQFGAEVRLDAVPLGRKPMNQAELKRWYSSHGFVHKGDGYMIRPASGAVGESAVFEAYVPADAATFQSAVEKIADVLVVPWRHVYYRFTLDPEYYERDYDEEAMLDDEFALGLADNRTVSDQGKTYKRVYRLSDAELNALIGAEAYWQNRFEAA